MITDNEPEELITPETAQDQHDKAMLANDKPLNLKVMGDLIDANDGEPLQTKSTFRGSLTESVMARHGFSKAEAERELEAFGA